MNRFAVASTLVLIAFAGCGGESVSTRTVTATLFETPSSSVASAAGHDRAPCRHDDIDRLVKRAAARPDALLVQYLCSSGWLVALAAAHGPDAGLGTFVFQAKAAFWVRQPRSAVCMRPSPVPVKLYALACLTR